MDLCITGLIRHGDQSAIKNLKRMKKSLQPKYFSLLYWNYSPETKIPSTNLIATKFKVNDNFLDSVSKFTGAIVIAKEPVNTERPLNWVHPQVGSLQLNPNPKATFSWLSALENASRQLTGNEDPQDLWLISRPDLYTYRYFLYLTRLCLEKLNKEEKIIFVAKRPYAHNVLETQSGLTSLPIDHFYIGFNNSRGVYIGLTDFFHEVILGNDKRQPLVNEFLIAQYLNDQNISLIQFPLPYILRRESWRASFVPNGPNKTRRMIATIRNLKFLMKLILELHIVAFFPKTLNKNLI